MNNLPSLGSYRMHTVNWELLEQYLADQCTAADRQQVDQWLAASPANRKVLADWRLAVTLADERADASREAEILASLRQEWGEAVASTTSNTQPQPTRLKPVTLRSPRWLAVAKIAAVAVTVTGAGVLWGRLASRGPDGTGVAVPPAALAVSTARGERRVLRFADGTVVTLAPASTLRWSPRYGVKDRLVELDGEAVFTVTHDAARPFVVRTPQAVARDLGTRFAVRAYPGDTATDVIVAEGVVAVVPSGALSPAGGNRVILHRGDGALVQRGGEMTLRHDVPLDDAFAWTTGRLVFRDLPLRDAVARLNRWYDVDVRYDAALGTRLLSASFEDEPSSEAILVIAAILDLRVSRNDRVYTLQTQ